jgi:hypothetical protein
MGETEMGETKSFQITFKLAQESIYVVLPLPPFAAKGKGLGRFEETGRGAHISGGKAVA